MTELTRSVKRRARGPFGHYKKRIVIILEPGDVLAMRLEKSRTIYRAEINDVFRQLAPWHALAEVRQARGTRPAPTLKIMLRSRLLLPFR